MKAGRSLLVVAICIASITAARAALLFDNMSNYENGVSGAGATTTASTPNTFMGAGYNLLAGATTITGFDIYPANVSGTTFNALRLSIYVWGSVNTSGTVNGTT